MVQRQRRGGRLEPRERAQWNLGAVRRFYINIFQRIGILLELRIHLQHHVILIQLRKNGGDQPLPESVVQGVVNVRRKNPQPRRGVAVDGERCNQALVQLVAGDVAQLRQFLQPINKLRSPVGEFLGINVFQAVLKLRAAHAVFHRQVLNGLQK